MTPERVRIFGLSLALLAGVFLGSAVAVSRFAYDAGASGIAVAGIRTIVMTLFFAIAVWISGQNWRMPRALVPVAVLNGVLMAAMTYGNIGAVEFIPIGLASLLFFTFPIVIAVIVLTLGIERVSPFRIAMIAVAFAGLAVMLSASVSSVDWRGVAFALVASLATAVNAVLVARYFRRVGIMVVTLHFSFVSMIVLALVAAFIADVRLPDSAAGWGGVFGVALFQAVATPMYLYAMTRIGALQVGMVANVQPVTSIYEAWLLFDEVLGVLQALGGALVLTAIAAMQWGDYRQRRRAVIDGPNTGREAEPSAAPD